MSKNYGNDIAIVRVKKTGEEYRIEQDGYGMLDALPLGNYVMLHEEFVRCLFFLRDNNLISETDLRASLRIPVSEMGQPPRVDFEILPFEIQAGESEGQQ